MCKAITQFIKTADEFPCFVWPVAEEHGIFYMPLYDKKDKIVEFQEIESIDDYSIIIKVPEDQLCSTRIGNKALFAYAKSEDFNDCIVGKKEEFLRGLKAYVTENIDVIDSLPYGKKYELFRTIDNDYLISKFFVDIITGDAPPQLKNWAKREIKPYKNCTHESEDSEICELWNDYDVPFKEAIKWTLEERVKTARVFKAVISNKLGTQLPEDVIDKLLQHYGREIFRINKAATNPEMPVMANLLCIDSIYTLPELLNEEENVNRGRVAIQSIDLSKTELRSKTLDKMAENMKDGTIYDYYFSSPCHDCIETIYKIKAQILSRNPDLDIETQMRFWDISSWDEAEKYSDCLKNIIYWECEADENSINEKAFLLLCGWDDKPSSVFGELSDEALNRFKEHKAELIRVRIPIQCAA